MDALLKAQEVQQRVIARSIINFKKLAKELRTVNAINMRVEAVKDAWKTFQTNHVQVELLVTPETKPTYAYFKGDLFEQTEELYNARTFYTGALSEMQGSVSDATSCLPSSDESKAFGSLRQTLPPIALPHFDGNAEQWETFRDRFSALLKSDKSLSALSKMYYLLSCLRGRAADCIAELPMTDNSFESAWKILTDRFEDKPRLVQRHLHALLSLAPQKSGSSVHLQELLDRQKVPIAALRNLNRAEADLWNDMLVLLVIQKLDPATRQAWQLRTSDTKTFPKHAELEAFLQQRVRGLDDTVASYSNRAAPRPLREARTHCANVAIAPASKCFVCSGNHAIRDCGKFKSLRVSARRDIVAREKRCLNCLSPKHFAKACPSKYSCRTCQQRHHTLLHEDGSSSSDARTTPSQAVTTSFAPVPTAVETYPTTDHNVSVANTYGKPPVLLATALIRVSAADREIKIRALLDQGSEYTYVTERLAQSLRAPRKRAPFVLYQMGGGQRNVKQIISINLSPHWSSTPSVSIDALVMRTLTRYTPPRDLPMSEYQHLTNISLADPTPDSANPIDLLIGSDMYSRLLPDALRGQPGQPIAQETIYGWILSGPLNLESSYASPRTYAHHLATDCDLETAVSKFWQLEDVPSANIKTPAEEKCERHFTETHRRDDTGRYIVRLPFVTTPPQAIGETRCRASRALAHTLRHFERDGDFRAEYIEFIDEYRRLGHMRPVPADSASPGSSVYIPHHAVIRPDSSTTYLRVVFNASCPSTNGRCLNDLLLTGPKLQTDLCAIILNWRRHRYVYAADIAKMYRQIRVDDRDLDYQRILWTNADGKYIDFQLLTVTYGMVCAPFFAMRVIQQLARDEGGTFPAATPILEENIYVDDLLFGHDDAEQLREMRDQLNALLARGGFRLRKWASNHPELLADLDETDHGLACSKSLSEDAALKVLGIGWNPRRDSFDFTVSLPPTIPNTKRAILALIAKIYEPLGWLTNGLR